MPVLSIDKSLDLTIEWYKAYKKRENLLKITRNQISNYLNKF